MEFTPIDMDAKIKECLDIARASEARGEMLDRVLLAGAATLALVAWVDEAPEDRKVVIRKESPGIGMAPEWRVTIEESSDNGPISAGGSCDESVVTAIERALHNWYRVRS